MEGQRAMRSPVFLDAASSEMETSEVILIFSPQFSILEYGPQQ